MPAGNENILSPLKVKEKSLNMLVFVFLNSLIKTLKAFQKYFETPKRIAKKKKKKKNCIIMKIDTARKNCFQGVFFSQGLLNDV